MLLGTVAFVLLAVGAIIGLVPVKAYNNSCGSAFFPTQVDSSSDGTTNLGAVVCSSVASRKPEALALLAGGLICMLALIPSAVQTNDFNEPSA